MTGSLLAMPMLIINMGGEMLYILEQRLRAQKIAGDKAEKVLNDVVRTMFSTKFIAELFKPQDMYSVHATRQIFDRLAHSSIMRLNTSSMDKLFDLMTMGFKQQMLCCSSPRQLIDVTLNHLDTVHIISSQPDVRALVRDCVRRLHETYEPLSPAAWFALKQSLCRFFHNRRVKVSLFLQDGMQLQNGCLVLNANGACPEGTEQPGCVRHFDSAGCAILTQHLPVANRQHCTPRAPGQPRTSLGVNLYHDETRERVRQERRLAAAAMGMTLTFPVVPPAATSSTAAGAGGAPVAVAAAAGAAGAAATAPSGAASRSLAVAESKGGETGQDKLAAEEEDEPPAKTAAPSTAGAAEMNLLADLLGAAASSVVSGAALKPFKLNLFAEDPFVQGGSGGYSTTHTENIVVDGKEHAERLAREMEEKLGFGAPGPSAGRGYGAGEGKVVDDDDDLLALMDEASGF